MPRCAEQSCARWRPERLAPKWAVGIRLNDSWYCSRACVQEAARAGLDSSTTGTSLASHPRLRIGLLLRHVNAISENDLNLALVTQRESGCRLGAELIRLRRVGADAVLRALAAQANVSYLTSFDLS